MISYVLNDFSTYPVRTYKERVIWFGFKASLFGKKKYEQNLTIALSEEQAIENPLEVVKNEITEKFNFTTIIIKKLVLIGAVLTALVFFYFFY